MRKLIPSLIVLMALAAMLACLPYCGGAQDSTSPARRIREISGPTLLAVGAISDGQFLKRGGSAVVGAAAPTATPGGSDAQVQFNDSSSFGGDSGLTFNKTMDVLSVGVGVQPYWGKGGGGEMSEARGNQ